MIPNYKDRGDVRKPVTKLASCPEICPEGIRPEDCVACNEDLPEPIREIFRRLCGVSRTYEAHPGLRKLCALYRADMREILEEIEADPNRRLSPDAYRKLQEGVEGLTDIVLGDARDTLLSEEFSQALEELRPSGV